MLGLYGSREGIWDVSTTTKNGKTRLSLVCSHGEEDKNPLTFNVVLGEETSFDDSVLGETFPIVLLSNPVGVFYNGRTMAPTGCIEKKNGLMMAFSIELEPGYEFTSVYNAGCRVHKYRFDKKQYVDIIASLNSYSDRKTGKLMFPRITINAINKAKNKMLAYQIDFAQKRKKGEAPEANPTVSVQKFDLNSKNRDRRISTTDFVAKCEEEGRSPIMLSIPSRPTSAVVVESAADIKHVRGMIKRNPRWNNLGIQVISLEDKSLRDIADDNYRGVTIAVLDGVTAPKVYDSELLKEAKELFDVVQMIYETDEGEGKKFTRIYQKQAERR